MSYRSDEIRDALQDGYHPDSVVARAARAYADLRDSGYEVDYCEEHDQIRSWGAVGHMSQYPASSCRWTRRFIAKLDELVAPQ